MRNISIIRNYNDLNKDYEELLTRIDKVLSFIEKKGDNREWQIEKEMPEHLNKRQILKIYKILKGE